MNARIGQMGGMVSLALGSLLSAPGWGAAQTYDSGSTGALGAFTPTTNTTVTLPSDGVLNYTTVNIPAGVTVTFTPNAANTPVTILATGDITLAGTLSVSGGTGALGPLLSGGAGGPGGFAGGNGAPQGSSTGASSGLGPGGGSPPAGAGFYYAPTNFVSLLPLLGGAGGAGGRASGSSNGAGGSGGGGALVLASSTRITLTGTIQADGGLGQDGLLFLGCAFAGGRGSGGAIRLVAPVLTGSGGILSAQGGGSNQCGTAPGGNGLIRLEAFSFVGFTATSTPAASFSFAPGPVTPAGTPGLLNLPTLTFTTVGGVAVPPTPTSSYATADVSLPAGTTNPVTVTLTSTNIPVGTIVSVLVLPPNAAGTSVNSTALTGTFARATATASVTLPPGQISVLNAVGTFTLPQLSRLVPPIDGELVERVLVAATAGGPSTVTLVTRSGKTRRVEEVLPSGK